MATETDAISGISSSLRTVDMQSVMTDAESHASEIKAASVSFERAMGRALVAPGEGSSADRESAELSYGGVVGLEKAEMLAKLDPESIRPDKTAADKEMDAIVERVKVMYSDFANWQVTWSMTTSLQKDLGHLLKGQ